MISTSENVQPAPRAGEGLEGIAAIPWVGRAILLVDLDAFFASVEQLDHPGWRGKPVIVGGGADRRGVVSTASYEARAYGVHSAMPSSTARRLCPDAIWTEGHFSRYREVSNAVMDILLDETPYLQQVSIDEAFLDVSPTAYNHEHPVVVAQRIQSRVQQLGVTCSIGVGTTKAVAKLASDMDKPRGLTVVLPGSEANFMGPLPVRALSGIGAAAEKTLEAHGIKTLGDLAAADDDSVERWLGKAGRVMLDRVRGVEDDPIEPDDTVKSVSSEMSFATDLVAYDDIVAAASTMAAKVGRRLRRKNLKGSTLALKVRYADRSVRSVQKPLPHPSDDEFEFQALIKEMLPGVWGEGMPLRLVGVAVTGFDGAAGQVEQLSLFDAEDAGGARAETDGAGERSRTASLRDLMAATDKVKERFGEGAVRYGREFRLDGNTTGSSSKNPADYK